MKSEVELTAQKIYKRELYKKIIKISFLFIRNFLLINKNLKIKESGYNATPKRFISL